jgi:DNA-binding transcriptional LysR family regulator
MMRLPDFEAWAIFAKVAQSGSFVAAAQELNLSQATVSKAVTRLERKLGTRLFHRTSRRLSLSDSGQGALEAAARLLAAGEALEAQASGDAARPRGAVRMTAPLSFGVRRLGGLLAEFFELYPEITVDLTLNDRRVDLVESGVDLALRIAEMEDSSLLARRLAPVRVLPVASPDYFARRGRPEHPRELSEHTCLIYTNTRAAGVWRFRRGARERYAVTVTGPLRVDNADVLRDLLLQGAGIAMQPDFLAFEDVRAGRLARALPDWRGPDLALCLLTPPGATRPARVEALIAFLTERIRASDWASG